MEKILADYNLDSNKINERSIVKLCNNAKANELKKEFYCIKNQIYEIFTMYKENEEFKEYHLILENAHAKKNYEYKLQLDNFPNIIIDNISKLEEIGLCYDKNDQLISGLPLMAGNFEIEITYFNSKDVNQSLDKKYVTFIVNADPKDLWKDIPSDSASLFYKKDTDSYFGNFSNKKIVVASKRGRSHAHEGTFRDDDFFVKNLDNNWSIVAIADGAGSAKFARKGSSIAVEYICEYFNSETITKVLDENVVAYNNINNVEEVESNAMAVDSKLEVKKVIVQAMYKGIKDLYEELKNFSLQEDILIKDLNTTLIFALIKKFEFGYAVLTFGVGDCPINILDNESSNVTLLNTLDVGEFGGGTRFITTHEIFSNANMGSRFGVNIFNDFSKLFLMTDGIYDPKFITESRLEDISAWNEFLNDLDGQNEDGIKIDFTDDLTVESNLLNWLDFWSKGNHDDRTLAIIY